MDTTDAETTKSALPRPRRVASHEERDLGEEYVFYDEQGDRFHVLNGTAREIYLLCDGSRSADEVACILEDLYDVDQDRARLDVRATIERLVELGLLAIA